MPYLGNIKDPIGLLQKLRFRFADRFTCNEETLDEIKDFPGEEWWNVRRTIKNENDFLAYTIEMIDLENELNK